MKHHTVWCHEASHSMMSWSITQYDVMEHHTVCSEYLPYTVKVVTQPTSEDDCILCWSSPSLHKVDGISTSQWRVPREYHTRGLIHTAQLPCTFVWIWHNQARPMNCSLIPRFVCVWTKSLRATVKGGKKKGSRYKLENLEKLFAVISFKMLAKCFPISSCVLTENLLSIQPTEKPLKEAE